MTKEKKIAKYFEKIKKLEDELYYGLLDIDNLLSEKLYKFDKDITDIDHPYYHMSYEEFDEEFSKEHGEWREYILGGSLFTNKHRDMLENNANHILSVIEEYDKKMFLKENAIKGTDIRHPRYANK